MNDHKCEGVSLCLDHPRWNVCGVTGESWRVYAPGHYPSVANFPTFPEAITYATAQARAQMVAAVQDGAA